MSDLITLVDNKVPMDKQSALQDAKKYMMKVMNNSFGVDNLSASSLLNASGKIIKVSLEILSGRPLGITFSYFDCRIYPTQEDPCIHQEPFCFPFYIRIPQNHFDTITNKVGDI